MNLRALFAQRLNFILPLVIALSAKAFSNEPKPQDSLRAVPQGVHLSVGTTFGARLGTLSEFLFMQDGDGKYKTLSELDWQILPALHFSAKAELQYRAFDFSIQAGGFFPGRCGIMEDSDWLNLDDVKNIYSISENSISHSFFLGTEAAWNAKAFRRLKIRPSLGIEYLRLSFSAKNGMGYYGDAGHSAESKDVAWDSGSAKFFGKGQLFGITYKYSTLFTWTGVSVDFLPESALALRLSADISPFFYAKAIDHHLNNSNGTFYLDAFPGFFAAGRCAARLSFRATRQMSFTASASFTKIGGAFGTSYISRESEGGPYYESEGCRGGTDGRWIDAAVSTVLRIF